jgi:hypothetical protein
VHARAAARNHTRHASDAGPGDSKGPPQAFASPGGQKARARRVGGGRGGLTNMVHHDGHHGAVPVAQDMEAHVQQLLPADTRGDGGGGGASLADGTCERRPLGVHTGAQAALGMPNDAPGRGRPRLPHAHAPSPEIVGVVVQLLHLGRAAPAAVVAVDQLERADDLRGTRSEGRPRVGAAGDCSLGTPAAPAGWPAAPAQGRAASAAHAKVDTGPRPRGRGQEREQAARRLRPRRPAPRRPRCAAPAARRRARRSRRRGAPGCDAAGTR